MEKNKTSQKVARTGIKKREGSEYSIDENGNVSEKRSNSSICRISKPGILKEEGYDYFIDEEGDVSRTKLKSSKKPLRWVRTAFSKQESKSLTNHKVKVSIHVPFGQETYKGVVISENEETLTLISGSFFPKNIILYKKNILKIEILQNNLFDNVNIAETKPIRKKFYRQKQHHQLTKKHLQFT